MADRMAANGPPPLLCCGVSPALQRTLTFPDWYAEGDVVRADSVHWSVGGKATNAARAVRRAGGRSSLLGFAGGPNGERMKQLLRTEGLVTDWIQTREESRICQSILDGEHRRVRELVENMPEVLPNEWDDYIHAVRRHLEQHSALLLCGSLPRHSSTAMYASLAQLAARADRPVILDAAGEVLMQALNHPIYLVKINRSELLTTTGCDTISRGVDALLERDVHIALITDGPGRAWLGYDRTRVQFTLPSIQAVNPIGGGDTVTGVCALSLARGCPPEESARQALGAGLAQTLRPNPADFDPDEAQRLADLINMEGV